MSASRTPFVHRGAYQDYGNRFGWRSQWLWSSFWANVWATFIGILVTISVARLLRTVVRLRERRTGQTIDTRTLESIAWTNLIDAIQDLLPGSIKLKNASSTHRVNWTAVIRQTTVAVTLFILFAATMAAGVATSYLISSDTAISQHPDCGLYVADDPTDLGLFNITRQYETAAQLESESWATAYFDGKVSRIPGSLIVPGSISIQKRNTTCPFASHMCYGESVQPVELTTGPISASAIGINAPKTLEFKRTSICSPLNMNSTYVDLVSQKGIDYTFEYYYGRSKWFGNATFQTVRHGNIGDVPSYQVGALWSNGFVDSKTEWVPMPELMPKPGSDISLIFIVSQKIFYQKQSHDPIFPALDPTKIPDNPETFWINLSGPGTVLACVDTTEWRDPTTTTPVWSSILEVPPSIDTSNTHILGGVRLLQNALVGSNTYSSIRIRLAAVLNAQSRISGWLSLPLDPEQWKVEVEQLFKISVARILIDVRDISRGAKANYWGYTKLPDADGICGDTYKLGTDGWSNVAIGWSLSVLAVTVLLIVQAVPMWEEKLLWEVLAEKSVHVANYAWRDMFKSFGQRVVNSYELGVDYIGRSLR